MVKSHLWRYPTLLKYISGASLLSGVRGAYRGFLDPASHNTSSQWSRAANNQLRQEAEQTHLARLDTIRLTATFVLLFTPRSLVQLSAFSFS